MLFLQTNAKCTVLVMSLALINPRLLIISGSLWGLKTSQQKQKSPGPLKLFRYTKLFSFQHLIGNRVGSLQRPLDNQTNEASSTKSWAWAKQSIVNQLLMSQRVVFKFSQFGISMTQCQFASRIKCRLFSLWNPNLQKRSLMLNLKLTTEKLAVFWFSNLQ